MCRPSTSTSVWSELRPRSRRVSCTYYKVPLSSLRKRCHHSKQWWDFRDWRGKSQRRWGAHPPLARRAREDGTLATAAAAVYPAKLNRIIANALAPDEGAPPTREEPTVQAPSLTPVTPAGAQVVELKPVTCHSRLEPWSYQGPCALRGTRAPSVKLTRELENAEALGGMQNPFASLSKLPKASEAGRLLRERLESAFDKFPGFVHDVGSVIRGKTMSPPLDGLTGAARGAILDLVGGRADEGTIGLQPFIFEAYRRLTGDPDEHLATWLRDGAPLGINRPVLSAGVFPFVPDEPVSFEYVTGLARSPTGWENYRSADEDTPTATSLLERTVDQDWADSYPQRDEVTRALGEGVVLNKLALLSKTKGDGSVKHRLVWDLRRSGVNLAVKQGERVVLPRLFDVVADLRELAAAKRDGILVGH